ncbi:hypothetical protein M1295_01535 [Patescibacteria group bacterium]|nr:hypothetical protein [Patescibacteria group bacterium]
MSIPIDMSILIAAVVTLVTEVVTKFFGTDTIGSLAAYIGFSILAAGAYAFLSATNFWPLLLNIGTYAAAIYAVLVHPVTKSS